MRECFSSRAKDTQCALLPPLSNHKMLGNKHFYEDMETRNLNL